MEGPEGPILVPVREAEDLAELGAVVAAAPGRPVVVLYLGRSAGTAVRCLRAGATDVICPSDLAPDEVGRRIRDAASMNTGWEAAVLEALPQPVAVRGPDGPVFRNAAHRRLAPQTFEGYADVLDGLGIEQLTDPPSGRVYLLWRAPVHGGPGAPVLEVLEDITGRHTDHGEIARQRDALAAQAEALTRANRELAVLERAKSEFIALAAHEIRTPLTALSSAVQILAREPGEGVPPDPARLLALAERNIRRLTALADDLLEYTKLEARHLTLAVASVDLGRVLGEAAEGVRAAADAGGVCVHSAVRPGVAPVQGDPARLAQVIRNLLAAAVARTPQGGTVRATVAALGEGDAAPWGPAGTDAPPRLPGTPAGWIELTVEDGAGADPPGHAAAPEPFGALGADPSDLPDGSAGPGLDLAVCRRVVDLHGGALWTEPGPAGRRVVARLPRLEAADARLLPVRSAWGGLRRNGHEGRLLVAVPGPDGPTLEAVLACCGDGPAGERRFVAVPERGEVVGVLAAGEADALHRRLAALGGSSNGNAAPIRVGWAASGAAPFFGDALARARAAVGPPGATVPRERGGEA
jgi:signal transduction histidine kinase